MVFFRAKISKFCSKVDEPCIPDEKNGISLVPTQIHSKQMA